MKAVLGLAVACCLMLVSSLAPPLAAAEPGPPKGFKLQTIDSPEGAKIYVRSGGSGPTVLLIHGFGDTGDMWTPLATALARDHRVIVPDLRGMGLSSHPAGGYDKMTQAADMHAVVMALGNEPAIVIGHDIGTMVAYAYAVRYPDKTTKLIVMDAPVPGVPPWDDILRTSPLLWHFNFGGPDMERLVKGRERIYLDRFWNDFAADPRKIVEATRVHYAKLYARPGAMHSSFEQFHAFWKDAEDNKARLDTKLTMPVLAIGGEKSFGETMAVVMRNAATDVKGVVIPNAGHWLMEENPTATTKAVQDFLSGT